MPIDDGFEALGEFGWTSRATGCTRRSSRSPPIR